MVRAIKVRPATWTCLVSIDCSELTFDEQLALAGSVSDGFEGRVVALAKDASIVLDILIPPNPTVGEIVLIVREFVARRPDAGHYSVEIEGESVVIRSPDPLKAGRQRRVGSLPPNVKKCPFCGFVTPYDEAYVVHVRAHGFT